MVNDLMSILLFVTFGNLAKKQKQFIWLFLKVAFFQKVRFVFQISHPPKKNIFQKTILNSKFKFSAKNTTIIDGKFKFQAQDRIFFFGDLEIEKTHRTF